MRMNAQPAPRSVLSCHPTSPRSHAPGALSLRLSRRCSPRTGRPRRFPFRPPIDLQSTTANGRRTEHQGLAITCNDEPRTRTEARSRERGEAVGSCRLLSTQLGLTALSGARIRMCMCSSMGTVLSPCRSRHISYACSHESADIQIGLTCPRDVPSRDAGGFR